MPKELVLMFLEFVKLPAELAEMAAELVLALELLVRKVVAAVTELKGRSR